MSVDIQEEDLNDIEVIERKIAKEQLEIQRNK